MSLTTRAAVLRQSDAEFVVEAVTLPQLGPREVLVEIAAVGMCHTDLIPRLPPMAQGLLPAILGHEGAGRVRAVGEDVGRVAVGDHVLLSFDYCGECGYCATEHPSKCVQFRQRNLSGRGLAEAQAKDSDGNPVASRWFGQSSFSELAVANENTVVVVDDQVPLEVFAPLGCGIQTGAGTVLNVMKPQPSDSIAIFGVGAVGMAAVMAAALVGMKRIIAIDRHESRLALARELGATHTIATDSKGVGPEAVVASGPVTFALDTTAVGEVMRVALQSLDVGGQLVLVGGGMDMFAVHPSMLTSRTVSYVHEGDSNPRVFMPHLIDAWRAGNFPVEKLVTTFPFDDINAAEQAAAAGDVVKPVLVMGASDAIREETRG